VGPGCSLVFHAMHTANEWFIICTVTKVDNKRRRLPDFQCMRSSTTTKRTCASTATCTARQEDLSGPSYSRANGAARPSSMWIVEACEDRDPPTELTSGPPSDASYRCRCR